MFLSIYINTMIEFNLFIKFKEEDGKFYDCHFLRSIFFCQVVRARRDLCLTIINAVYISYMIIQSIFFPHIYENLCLRFFCQIARWTNVIDIHQGCQRKELYFDNVVITGCLLLSDNFRLTTKELITKTSSIQTPLHTHSLHLELALRSARQTRHCIRFIEINASKFVTNLIVGTQSWRQVLLLKPSLQRIKSWKHLHW